MQAETRTTVRLLRAAGRGLRAVARLLWPPEASLAFLAAVVVALELMGNSLATDRGDAIGVAFLGTGLLVLTAWQRAAPSRWIAALGAARRWFARQLATQRVSVGLDFRGAPPLPRAFPPLLRVSITCSAGAVALLAAWPAWAEGGLRGLLAGRSYSLYLLALGLAWLGVALGVIGALWVAHAALHDLYVSTHLERRARARTREALATLAVFAALLLGWIGLPGWVPLAGVVALALVALAAAAVPARGGLQLLWRRADADDEPGAIRAVSLRRAHAGELCSSLLALTALVLATRGGGLLGADEETARTMPVTCALGGLLAWAGLVGACGFNAPFLHQLAMRRSSTRRRAPRRVHVEGALPRARVRALRRSLRAKGWRLALGPRGARREDVRVRLVERAPAIDPWHPPSWPLQVEAAELDSALVLERLARRDLVQRRRRLVEGLGRMFRFLRRRELEAGSGYWVAPQHWFVLGLSRDEEEPRFDPLVDTILFGSMGPSFERAIDWPAREHLLEVLRGMQVDLIFVEDGVRYPALRKVLRILFELHDTWGGGRRLEERFLQGIPGLRAVLHDFDLEHPFESTRYPEPDYEDIGRARVLHLFRDRGEDEESVEVPSSGDRVLVGV